MDQELEMNGEFDKDEELEVDGEFDKNEEFGRDWEFGMGQELDMDQEFEVDWEFDMGQECGMDWEFDKDEELELDGEFDMGQEFDKDEEFVCHSHWNPKLADPCRNSCLGFPVLSQSWLFLLLQDVLCVPERRLLEDSRNLPITSGCARSERLLLFDDVLVLIQGNSFQSFDLKLVWVDENCGEKSAPGLHSLRITTPEETFVLSTKDPQMKAVWRWKLEQAVRQALNGKRDFPLWGRSGEGSEAPSRRFFSYVFRTEGRLRGATYEGEWLWGKPHGK
ncbi:hypothetical protein EK904_015210 [Melospiza melodia maxima]|nr:hypothetical protein EK904_015210 [Melospiza melodia maxima]